MQSIQEIEDAWLKIFHILKDTYDRDYALHFIKKNKDLTHMSRGLMNRERKRSQPLK